MSNAKCGGRGGLDCYDFVLMGRPDNLSIDPLLWVDTEDKGTVFDDSGDETPDTFAHGTGTGFNFGLPAHSDDFNGSVRTVFDKSGNNHHMMKPSAYNDKLLAYSPGADTDLKYQSNALINKTTSDGTKLFYPFEETYADAFDLYMVVSNSLETTTINQYQSIFASMSIKEGYPDTGSSWQIGRGATKYNKSGAYLVLYSDASAGVFTHINNFVGGDKHLIRVSYDGNNTVKGYWDGELKFTKSTAMDMGALSMFCNRSGELGIINTNIHELVMFEEVLSDADAKLLDAYINCKHFGTELSNSAPIGTEDSYEIDADSTIIISVDDLLSNDYDLDGDSIGIDSVDASPLSGTLTDNGDGTYTYDTNGAFDDVYEGETSTDSFTYTLTDIFGNATTVTVNITINGVGTMNHAPVTEGISNVYKVEDASWAYTIPEGTFTDEDGDELTYTVSDLPDGVTFDADTQTFTGLVTTSGSHEITVTVTDPYGESVSSTFTLTIVAVNDAPELAIEVDDQTTYEDTAWEFTIPEGTFTDEDGDELTYSVSGLPDGVTFDADTQTFSGTVADAGDYEITVTVMDSSGETASDTFVLTVLAVNSAPDAIDDMADVLSNSTVTISVLDNDTDDDNDTLSITSIDTSSTTGTVTDNGDGTVTYDPNGQFDSLAEGETDTDEFSYTITDGTDTDTAYVTVTITGAPYCEQYGAEFNDLTDAEVLAGTIGDLSFTLSSQDGDDVVQVGTNTDGDKTFDIGGSMTWTTTFDMSSLDTTTYSWQARFKLSVLGTHEDNNNLKLYTKDGDGIDMTSYAWDADELNALIGNPTEYTIPIASGSTSMMLYFLVTNNVMPDDDTSGSDEFVQISEVFIETVGCA